MNQREVDQEYQHSFHTFKSKPRHQNMITRDFKKKKKLHKKLKVMGIEFSVVLLDFLW